MEHIKTEGIDRAVLEHPEPYGDDHRLVLNCPRREPDLFLEGAFSSRTIPTQQVS